MYATEMAIILSGAGSGVLVEIAVDGHGTTVPVESVEFRPVKTGLKVVIHATQPGKRV